MSPNYEQKILSEFGLHIKIAGEIEFYIEPKPASEAIENSFQQILLEKLSDAKIKIWNMQNEVAPGQYEIALQPVAPEDAADNISVLKQKIIESLNQINSLKGIYYKAIFDAKPYDDLPGSGLHIHIGVHDKNGNPVLERAGERGKKDNESEIMLNIIGGLCSTMLVNFIKFAPTEKSYKRFTAKRNSADENNPLQAYNNAPVNVSWGGNNRTTAIRIPSSSYDESQRHIEHRVAGADANPKDVINAILEGIYIGLKEKSTPPTKIHGNAFDKQYDYLKPFPKNLAEAKNFNQIYKF